MLTSDRPPASTRDTMILPSLNKAQPHAAIEFLSQDAFVVISSSPSASLYLKHASPGLRTARSAGVACKLRCTVPFISHDFPVSGYPHTRMSRSAHGTFLLQLRNKSHSRRAFISAPSKAAPPFRARPTEEPTPLFRAPHGSPKPGSAELRRGPEKKKKVTEWRKGRKG